MKTTTYFPAISTVPMVVSRSPPRFGPVLDSSDAKYEILNDLNSDAA